MSRHETKVTIKKQERGPSLKLIFFAVSESFDSSFNSQPIDVGNLALVKFNLFPGYNTMTASIMVQRNKNAKCSLVKMIISSTNFEKELICLDSWSESIYITKNLAPDFVYGSVNSFSLEVNLTVQDASHVNSLGNQALYEDRQFTDFKLRTPDGSVGVHKAVLASHSEVFRALLSDNRTAEGTFSIQGVTVQALQHLKDYIYLGTLPVTGLPELLLIAIQSKMEKLKDECIMKLASIVSAEDLDALIDFAIQNNIPDLVRAMLSFTSDSTVHGANQARRNRLQFCTLNFGRLALE